MVANAHAGRFTSKLNGREPPPSGGWEQVVVWAFADVEHGIVLDAACALNISVAATVQRQGLARLMLDALCTAVRGLGHDTGWRRPPG